MGKAGAVVPRVNVHYQWPERFFRQSHATANASMKLVHGREWSARMIAKAELPAGTTRSRRDDGALILGRLERAQLGDIRGQLCRDIISLGVGQIFPAVANAIGVLDPLHFDADASAVEMGAIDLWDWDRGVLGDKGHGFDFGHVAGPFDESAWTDFDAYWPAGSTDRAKKGFADPQAESEQHDVVMSSSAVVSRERKSSKPGGRW